MAGDRVWASLATDRDDVGAYRAPAHLPDARQRVVDLKLVRKTPLVRGFKGHVVFDQVEVWDVDGDEAILFVTFHQLVAGAGDKARHIVLCQRQTGRKEKDDDCERESRYSLCASLRLGAKLLVEIDGLEIDGH